MAIDVTKLEVSLEEGERWRRTLNITVPSELVRAERQAAVKQLSARLQIPGFRAGKVPASVVEKRFGPALQQEFLDRVIGEAYRGVLAEKALRPISEGEVADIDYQPESDLKFQISFDVAPQVELGRMGGFRIEQPSVRVTDDDVERVLTRVREQEGTWVPIEEGSPVPGERVAVRLQQLDEEGDEPRPYEFTLGADEALPEVERAIESLEVGESGDFTITFPADESDPEKPGDEQRLRIHLESRKRLELPDLDDEFARSAGDFENLEALRGRIRDDLVKEAEREAEAELRARIMQQLLDANPFEIPESMIDQYVRSVLGNPENLSEERLAEAKEHFRARAVHGVKRYMVVSRIAEKEKIEATVEEVDARIEEIAESGGTTPNEVYSTLQKSGQLEELEREITERKVFDFLKDQSEITPSQAD